MATIAPPAPPAQKPSSGGRGDDSHLSPPRGYGDDGRGGGSAAFPLRRYYTGMWFALAPVVMLFTAFTSAYVVRQGLSEDWRPTDLPSILWWNSAVLLASSATMELARRRARGMRSGTAGGGLPASREEVDALRRWLLITSVLGVIFLAGQIVAWKELANRGIYVATNPSSSFFYLLTATHGLHLLGGVTALLTITLLVARRLTPGRRTGVAVTGIYWHFMDLLWIYVLVLMTVLK